ncbi:hypothetical protein K432DRAFT_470143, partial [Lepidopterella palustris CBS 459.81]
QWRSLSLYHFHVLYDAINFAGISNCAAICCSFWRNENQTFSHYCTFALFALFDVAFCILYCIRLSRWDDATPGQCYNPRKLALFSGRHPEADFVYFGITCVYFWISLALAVFRSKRRKDAVSEAVVEGTGSTLFVLIVGMLQLPVHLYSAIALRASNQSLLQDASEVQWGFGQIVALILVGSTFIQCAKGIKVRLRVCL